MDHREFIAAYILANARNGTLYVGVTSNLPGRIRQHRDGLLPGFSRTYGLKRLVWYQPHETIVGAIRHEKLLKRYRRAWKTNLIERDNPHWDDLYSPCSRPAGGAGSRAIRSPRHSADLISAVTLGLVPRVHRSAAPRVEEARLRLAGPTSGS